MAVAAAVERPSWEPDIEDFERFCFEELRTENFDALRLYDEELVMLEQYFAGIRETLILVPKKNGKSSLLGAVNVHRLKRQWNASCALAAASRDQAMVLFDQMRGFIQRNPALADDLTVLRGHREIRRGPQRDFTGLIKVFAADADTADGWLGHLATIDELHRQKSLALYGVFRDGLGPLDGQMLTISTAGDHEDSPLGEMRKQAYAMPGLKRNGAYRTVSNDIFVMHEWALDGTDDLSDIALVKTANPAPWQTENKLRERHDSPTMTPEQWARFAAGIWGQGTVAAFDKAVFADLGQAGKVIEDGRKVTLGFDGSRRKDATALVACDIESGHLQTLGIWERPLHAGDDWEVPEAEVEQAVDDAFERWDIWRMYADPPYWELPLDRWAGKHGKDRVVRWWTNHVKAMAQAVRAFQNDMKPGEMSHDGDAQLVAHVGNAVRQDTRMRDGEEYLWLIRKDGPKSQRKIDAAMAAILAWEARGDAIRAGVLEPVPSGRYQW